MHLHLLQSDIKLGLSSGRLTVKNASDGSIKREFPFSDVDGISVFGKPQLSTSLLRGCMQNSIPVLFYSDDGHYFGRLSPFDHVDPFRQKSQIYASDDKRFCLEWSKNIVRAKINNSLTLLKSQPENYDFTDDELSGMNHSLTYIDTAANVPQVLGFEGNAAKAYFKCLSKLVKDESFVFKGRSTRPPKDAFNSMLSYGYSVLYRNVIGAIEASGLNSYFAFLHAPKRGHAALASDLVEEWRAVLVDRVVLELVNEGALSLSEFTKNKAGAVYMDKRVMGCLSESLGEAMIRAEMYFLEDGDRKRYGFQVALQKKVVNLINAIEGRNPNIYKPFLWISNSRSL